MVSSITQMKKKELVQYMVDKKDRINQLEVFSRDLEINPTKNFITSIVGPRRAGKTYSMYDYILNKKGLDESEFLFIDFEEASMAEADFKDIGKAVESHLENYGEEPEFIFLDEVQNVKDWQKAVRSLFETKKYYLFVSGSSSKLLSKEIATSLRGRTLTKTIMPLSFREYLDRKKKGFEGLGKMLPTSKKNEIKNHLKEYLENGGFPPLVFESGLKDRFFNEYLDLVIFRDLVERHGVENVFAVKFLIKNILGSFSKEFSTNKVYNSLKSQGVKVSKKSLYNYLSYLEDAFFSFSLKKFYYSQKKASTSIPKIYLNDPGLATTLAMNFSENIGRLMENCVFVDLFREKKNNSGLEFYYWKGQKREVDFVKKEDDKIVKLIQVCYNLEDEETRKREIEALLEAGKKLDCNEMLVITWDYEGQEDLGREGVKFLPLWKWLLMDN